MEGLIENLVQNVLPIIVLSITGIVIVLIVKIYAVNLFEEKKENFSGILCREIVASGGRNVSKSASWSE